MIGAEGEAVLSAKDAARLTAAFEPLVGEHAAVIVGEIHMLVVNAKRMEKDLAAARIEGAERALLERDVAEVQRAINEPDDSRALTSWKDHDCREWLARAKAVLG